MIVAPRLGHIGLLDFARADEAIREGERAMESALGSLSMLGIERQYSSVFNRLHSFLSALQKLLAALLLQS